MLLTMPAAAALAVIVASKSSKDRKRSNKKHDIKSDFGEKEVRYLKCDQIFSATPLNTHTVLYCTVLYCTVLIKPVKDEGSEAHLTDTRNPPSQDSCSCRMLLPLRCCRS